MDHIVKINSVHPVTHDVNRYRFYKPEGFQFTPGQAADVSINLPEWKDEKRPFTFTCLNSDPYLEFTIKSYPNNGVTQQLPNLKPGNELIISDPWGAIEYKGEGYFIAGGAGITPFIAILRQLFKDGKIKGNKLFFSNKTSKDIIYETELKNMLCRVLLKWSQRRAPSLRPLCLRSEFIFFKYDFDQVATQKGTPNSYRSPCHYVTEVMCAEIHSRIANGTRPQIRGHCDVPFLIFQCR